MGITKLELIFKLHGYQKFKSRYTDMTIAELPQTVWNVNIHIFFSDIRHKGIPAGSWKRRLNCYFFGKSFPGLN